MTETPETATADPLAVLEEIRRRYLADRNGAAAFRQSDDAARDIPRLLAGYDALLKLAAELEEKSARLMTIGDDDYDPSARIPDRAWAGRAYGYRDAAADVRSAIAAALLAEEVPAS